MTSPPTPSFIPTGLGATWFTDRYAIHPKETWVEASTRVAKHVAQAEPKAMQEMHARHFASEISSGRFMPGGRIWWGAGKPKAQLLNCFVIPTADTREGWGKAFYDVTVISSLGGGVGFNASPIRPRNTPINGTGGRASGSVSFMEAVNAIGGIIKDGAGRRAAYMFCLDINHPDLPEFLDKKLDQKLLNNANVSVVLNIDPDVFVRMVRNNERIKLTHPKLDSESYINARWLWDRLVDNAWKSGEPGVLNGYLANKMSNIWYHKPLVSTNPCGEIWLEEYGCCDLGALVLPSFVRGGAIDWAGLSTTVRRGVRFLDDVLSINDYPLAEIEANCQDVRRIGLGVMGLHNMLLMLGLKYSSPQGRVVVGTVMRFIRDEAYRASIELAQEKGAFPAFNANYYLQGEFIKTLPEDIRDDIREFGIRNCALLTVAPTGTTSVVRGVSSGIEPIFAPVYFRRYYGRGDEQDVQKRELVVDPLYEEFGELCEGAHDIAPADHFAMQRIVQQYVDNAVSKTVNLPSDITRQELGDIWLEYLPYLKGTTLYRSGSRGQEPVEVVPVDEVQTVVAQYTAIPVDDLALQVSMDCINGACEVSYGKT